MIKERKSNWEHSAARTLRVTDTPISHGLSPKRIAIAGQPSTTPPRRQQWQQTVGSRKIANAEWGDGVVEELAADLARL